jgi:predicted transcriptional regulator
MIHQILKDLLIKVTITAVIILAVVGFGTYKYIQFKEEEIKGKYVEELSAQRKAYDSQIEQINKVNAESLEKQKALIEDYKKHLDSIQLDYEQKVKELEDLRQARIKELTKKINQEPEAVLDELAHKFGFEVVPAGDKDE